MSKIHTMPNPLFDQLAEMFSKQIDSLCNLHVLPDLFAEFMQKASPAEIELLMNTLSERCHGGVTLTLAECMRECLQQPAADAEPFGDHLERPAAEAPTEEPEPDLPEWLTLTPHECKYFLAMEEGGLDCQECQNIDLSRKEFLILKIALAKLRSVPVPLEQPEWLKAGGTEDSLWDELEPEEIAREEGAESRG